MKLTDLDDECLFDDIPKLYNPKTKVFITHLMNLEEMIPPKKFPKIITSAILAEKMKTFFATKKIVCNSFVILKTDKPYELKLSNGIKVQVLLIESKDYTSNLMVLIRKDNHVSHLYVNMLTQIRYAVMSKNFTRWVSRGIKDLYMNLKIADETPDPDSLSKDIQKIIFKLVSNKETKAHVRLPLFGYENFLAVLIKRIPNLVYLSEDIWLENMQSLKVCQNPEKARVFVYTKFITNDPKIYKISYLEEHINNIDILTWTPWPEPFQLELLTRLVHPERIFGIINIYTMERQVPKYLHELTKKELLKMKMPNGGRTNLKLNVRAISTSTTSDENQPKIPKLVRVLPKMNYIDQNSEASDSS